MEFKYDAIFGLTFNSTEPIYEIDLAQIPQDFDPVEFLEKWIEYNKIGLVISEHVKEYYQPIYSNY